MLQNIETLIKSKIRNLQNVSNQASAAKYIKEDYTPRKNDSNYIEVLLKQVKVIYLSIELWKTEEWKERMLSELLTLRSQTLHLSDQLKKANKLAKDVFKTQLLKSAVAIKNKRKYDNEWKLRKGMHWRKKFQKKSLDQCVKKSSRC